jgi:hypothetical protein
VAEYLQGGGELSLTYHPNYYPVVLQVCPICGVETNYVPDLNSKHRGSSWACGKGNETHYWMAHTNSLREFLAENPWLYPLDLEPEGTVVYSGLKWDEIITESYPRPDG